MAPATDDRRGHSLTSPLVSRAVTDAPQNDPAPFETGPADELLAPSLLGACAMGR